MSTQPAFEYKELDQEGLDTLDAISSADKLNQWMFDTIKPYSSGKILEIGSGIGNISAYFFKAGFEITLSDIRENYCQILKNKFADQKTLKEVILLDLVAEDFDTRYKGLLNSFDTVFALNVVEHIEDDQLAIKNAKKLLASGGHLIILVPAYPFLYNRFDEELYHFRRYSRTQLNTLFLNEQLKIVNTFSFNAAGIAGWYVSGKIQKNKTIPKNQISLYNKLVFLFRIIDKILFNKIGLSVITVGKKG